MKIGESIDTEKTKNIPKLRFREFADEWQAFMFSSAFDRITTKNKENNLNILTISAQDGLVRQDKFFNKLVAAKDVSGYYLLHRDDFAYNKSYSKGYPMGAIKRLIHDGKGVVSTLYICFRGKHSISISFFEHYFEGGNLVREIEKIAQEGARNHGLLNISISDFFEMNIVYPGVEEQQKIADFLTTVDEKISKLEKKKAGFEKYKKGVMQQIFSQKIRFKKSDGSSYPDWEEKRLGDIVYEPQKDKLLDPSKHDLLTVKLHKQGVVPSGKRPRLTRAGRPYYQRFVGELIVGRQNFHNGGIAIVDEKTNGLVASNALSSFLPKGEQVNIEFVYNYISQKKYYEKVGYLLGGTGQKEISSLEFLNMKIYLPSKEEQGEIIFYINYLNKKSRLLKEQLDWARQFKKALLQQMFV